MIDKFISEDTARWLYGSACLPFRPMNPNRDRKRIHSSYGRDKKDTQAGITKTRDLTVEQEALEV